MDGLAAGRLFDRLNWRNEAVAAARDGLNKVRGARVVSQHFADLIQTIVQAQLEVDERLTLPDKVLNLVPRLQFPRMARQRYENLEWLRRKFDGGIVAAQLAASSVQFKNAEAQN